MNQPWTIDEGLKLIRALQPKVRTFGYHIALGGGVLNNGQSHKDLDLYFLPLDNPDIAQENTHGLLGWLTTLWGEPQVIGDYPEPEPEDYPGPAQVGGPIQLGQIGARIRQDALRQGRQRAMPDENAPFVEDFSFKRKRVPSHYKHKLKFERVNSDRIDVFIV